MAMGLLPDEQCDKSLTNTLINPESYIRKEYFRKYQFTQSDLTPFMVQKHKVVNAIKYDEKVFLAQLAKQYN